MTLARSTWWREGNALHRFVCDLLAAELQRIRPRRSPVALPWAPDMRFEEDLGADSLERLKLSTALAEAVQLARSAEDDRLLSKPTVGEWVEAVATGLEVFSAELTFRTSGSTGGPKWCSHELVDLEAEVDRLALLFPSGRVVSAVPSHHIYGFLFTILLPLRLGGETIDVRSDSPARLTRLLRAGDVAIGHPEFWRAFGRLVPRVGPGVSAVSSTAPCPLDVAHAVTATGVDRLIEVYGSSETAGIGWRDDPLGSYGLFDYWRRGAADDALVRTLPSGAERVVMVPDRLIWEDERHIRPAGRSDGVVQVGGINVSPGHVQRVLESHPDVSCAAVRLMGADEGERLKAFVVPQNADADVAALRDELWSWLDTRLTAPERPKSIVFGSALPTGALGKSADWPIDRSESQPSA